MPEALDMTLVSAALVGAAWFVGRRFMRRDDSACASACGKCETPPPHGARGGGLVQIGKPKR